MLQLAHARFRARFFSPSHGRGTDQSVRPYRPSRPTGGTAARRTPTTPLPAAPAGPTAKRAPRAPADGRRRSAGPPPRSPRRAPRDAALPPSGGSIAGAMDSAPCPAPYCPWRRAAAAAPAPERWRRRAERPAKRAPPSRGSWPATTARWAPDPRVESAARAARAAARNLPAGTTGWRAPARCAPPARPAGWRRESGPRRVAGHARQTAIDHRADALDGDGTFRHVGGQDDLGPGAWRHRAVLLLRRLVPVERQELPPVTAAQRRAGILRAPDFERSGQEHQRMAHPADLEP